MHDLGENEARKGDYEMLDVDVYVKFQIERTGKTFG